MAAASRAQADPHEESVPAAHHCERVRRGRSSPIQAARSPAADMGTGAVKWQVKERPG